MSNNNEDTPNRDGKTAPSRSSSDPIEALRTPKIPLGDIDDLHAYVRKIARPLAGDEQELEDLLSQGILLAYERFKGLGEGERLSEALSLWLESRLRDYRRTQHREWRRNSRAGTSYTLQSPTGLAWEHSATTSGMFAADDTPFIESRLRLQLFKRREDLCNPRLIGRYRRVPSAAGLATAAAAEVWAAIEEERALTNPKPFRFLKSDESE
jgi:DNA-directed RNA polymerase specialized sigma24 family protein